MQNLSTQKKTSKTKIIPGTRIVCLVGVVKFRALYQKIYKMQSILFGKYFFWKIFFIPEKYFLSNAKYLLVHALHIIFNDI
jgi:hypothetical protein